MNEENKQEELLETQVEESLPTDEASENSGVEASQSEELPEKFKGKSAAEIARAALEAERAMHERAGEAASIRRQMQETQQQIAELQARYKPTQEVDPIEELEKAWDEDPKQATISTIRRMQETAAEKERRVALEARQREGLDFYHKQKSTNPDFAEREADMVELSRKFSHIIRPEFANSKDVMEALHLLARGAKLDVYEQRAAEKAKKQQEIIKDEKRKATSERAGASSSSSDNGLADIDAFARMTPAQMAAELEKSARLIGRK